MRWTALVLAWTMLFSPLVVFAQEEKPDAAVTPVSAMGEITEGERGIIFNTLQSNLSKNYQIISQEDYARAEEKAFEELDAEQCTAEQCIRKIQDILQVDRLFVLQIIREEGYSRYSHIV